MEKIEGGVVKKWKWRVRGPRIEEFCDIEFADDIALGRQIFPDADGWLESPGGWPDEQGARDALQRVEQAYREFLSRP